VSGFCVEVRSERREANARALRLVDLGVCTHREGFVGGPARAAWVRAEQSRHWFVRRTSEAVLVIEGSPDRLPRDGESLQQWLPGRWGSFRGFEIAVAASPDSAKIAAFVDPLCTRPIFYKTSPGQLLIADKLSTLALNDRGDCAPHWDAVLPAMILGSAYLYHSTTLEGAGEIAAGETVLFDGVQLSSRLSNTMPADEATSPEAVRSDPTGSLKRALEASVRDCWSDGAAALMLSGGLDSRAILALAGDARKAVTLEMSARETELARQIAQAANAEFFALPFPRDEWLHRLQEGYWIAAASRDSEFVNDIGLNQRLAALGIQAIAHGYLFDTLLKGWLIRPRHQHVDLSNTVYGLMGPAGVHFRETTSRASFHADKDVLGLLSEQGKRQAVAQLKVVAASLRPVSEGQFDITFERHILGWVSKQVHYGCYLSWLEGLDLHSPVFHPALWSWYRNSRAEDRYLGKAYRQMLRTLGHPVFGVADANTGAPIGAAEARWTERAQDKLWYRALRVLWRTVRRDKPAPFTDARSGVFRGTEGKALFEFALETLRGNRLFNAAALERALAEFLEGQDRPFEPLMTIAGAAQWQDLLANRHQHSAPQIQEVTPEQPAPPRR